MGLSPAFDVDHEIYLGTIDHGVVQSLDGGATWRAKRGVPALVKVTSVAVSPNYANYYTAFAGNTGQIWRTTNGGDSWNRTGASSIVMRGGLKYTWIAISPRFATDHPLLVGSNNGVFRSTNSGSTFQEIGRSQIGPSTVIRQIEFSPNFRVRHGVCYRARQRTVSCSLGHIRECVIPAERWVATRWQPTLNLPISAFCLPSSKTLH